AGACPARRSPARASCTYSPRPLRGARSARELLRAGGLVSSGPRARRRLVVTQRLRVDPYCAECTHLDRTLCARASVHARSPPANGRTRLDVHAVEQGLHRRVVDLHVARPLDGFRWAKGPVVQTLVKLTHPRAIEKEN